MAPCKFFLQGRCTKGETCSFQHLRSDIRQTKDSGVARNTQPLAALHGERPMFEPTHIALPIRSPSTTLCHFFQSGTCTKGVLCTFSHDIKPWAPREQTQPVSVDAGRANTADFRSTVDCKFHFRGRCSQGASCPYSHGNEGNRESAVTGVNTGKVSRLKPTLFISANEELGERGQRRLSPPAGWNAYALQRWRPSLKHPVPVGAVWCTHQGIASQRIPGLCFCLSPQNWS